MLKVAYTDADKEKINQFRYHYPNHRIQKRFEMFWLHACGIKVTEIARLTGANPYMVCGIIKKYRDSGIEEIVKTNYYCPKSSLEQYRTSIIEEFTKRPPAASIEAAHRIKQLFGAELSPQRVRIFVKKLGMRFRRTGSVPAKADFEQQEKFKKNASTPDFTG
ncbi:MAG: winged helix-turn-helix domain-containing protein [Planctomycetaceae bacterium]|jgi:transposase|nr:winged helix-turn-helix domain-containing protein [Planctomycetaceae bacterium]